jgi:aspartate/methionine/tyrosine aminotransferase
MTERQRLRSARRAAIAPFIVMEVMAAANRRAAAGGEVLHLEVGEPAGRAPEAALAAARSALETGTLGYTEALGLPSLRARIARHYQDQHGLELSPERVAVTAGASGAFILAFLAAFDAGARVAVGSPGYPAYRNILAALDIEVVPVITDAGTRFQPTPAQLDRIPGRLDGLVIASPANPTGTMLRPDELAELTAWSERRQARLVSDEIYHGITFGRPADTALRHGTDGLVVNSFSKFFCMTGWRLGWLVMPEDLIGPITRLAQNLFISPSALAQHAAIGAFDDAPELQGRVSAYRRSRDCLVAGLADAGLDVLEPEGAFYLYLDISPTGIPASEVCRRLLAETGVALTPGTDFDPARGEHWLRVSFAGPEGEVAEASARLTSWLRRHLDRGAIR